MSSVVISGDVSGSVTLQAPSAAGTTVLTLPATSGTVVTTATSSGISGSAITTGTVGVSVGGTGQTTAAAAFNALSPITTTGDLIIGNGANSATRLAIGSNNTVLTSNGTTATWAAAGGGSIQTEIFTGPGTWTKPSSVTQVRVTVVGGGGGSASPGFSAGGNSGGTSSFGPAVSATGGVGRNPGVPAPNLGTPGTGTVSSGTLLKTSNAGSSTYFALDGTFNNPISSSPGPGATTYSSSTNSLGAGWAGVNIPVGSGGYGGTSIAIVPVSAPVAVTVGSGGPSGSSPGTGGVGGAVVVEYVG